MINIDELTIGQLKEIKAMSGFGCQPAKPASKFIGKKCIIRTYSAGVWFGVVSEKEGKEVIVTNAQRLYRWWAAESISLSAVSIHGVKPEKSKICEPVSSVWLEAIEIIPCESKSIESIEGCDHVKAK